MAYISDQKFAEKMGLTTQQVRKMVNRLDIPFVSSGKKTDMVYMFDAEELDQKINEMKQTKKDRKRRPRKKREPETAEPVEPEYTAEHEHPEEPEQAE